jgi:D-3-phosphoglycerate dehydrogenase
MAEVLVVEGIAGPAVDALEAEFTLERAATPAAAARLDDVRALIVRNATQVDRHLLETMPRLEVIGRAGAGLDNVDVAAARAAGVSVTYAPAENTAATAEHTIALALAVAHRVCELDRVVRAGRWDRRFGTELAGETWGVVGLGRIGRTVATRARGIGMRAVAFDPALTDADARALGVEPMQLESLAAVAKVVSLHVPLTVATRHLVSKHLLDAMRADAILVNTARGGLVDEAALGAAIGNGTIAGAGLDVRDPEPPATPDALADLDQVVLTPHVAGLSREAQRRVSEAVAQDVRAVLGGRDPRWPAPSEPADVR